MNYQLNKEVNKMTNAKAVELFNKRYNIGQTIQIVIGKKFTEAVTTSPAFVCELDGTAKVSTDLYIMPNIELDKIVTISCNNCERCKINGDSFICNKEESEFYNQKVTYGDYCGYYEFPIFRQPEFYIDEVVK